MHRENPTRNTPGLPGDVWRLALLFRRVWHAVLCGLPPTRFLTGKIRQLLLEGLGPCGQGRMPIASRFSRLFIACVRSAPRCWVPPPCRAPRSASWPARPVSDDPGRRCASPRRHRGRGGAARAHAARRVAAPHPTRPRSGDCPLPLHSPARDNSRRNTCPAVSGRRASGSGSGQKVAPAWCRA
jgi:hypothetical protein